MEYKDFVLLGKRAIGKKTYELNDSQGFVNTTKDPYKLPAGFYGGRITNVGKTSQPGVYLLIEGQRVIDLLLKKDELVNLKVLELQDILAAKGIMPSPKATKAQLLFLLGVQVDETTE